MITISLCMIVRNEETILDRCLDSLQDIVDEIIIVDTGSTDKTKDVASQYTTLLFDYPWGNDFSAARNESFSKASMDYCMWADADDILPPQERAKLLDWKTNTHLSNAPDVVMMKYATAFDAEQNPTFLYYRERLLRNHQNFIWKGRVHEAIAPSGKIEYLDIYLEHRSNKTFYSDRNLKIYEEMLSLGETLAPRDRFYYARELYYHNHFSKAVENFSHFLSMPDSFVENKVEACRLAAYSSYPLGDDNGALTFLLKGLSYRVPSGELCCDIAKHFMDRNDYEQACFWYHAALSAPMCPEKGGFVSKECYGYLPCLQLSVCYDKLGRMKDAIKYHNYAGKYNPHGTLYRKNQPYFSRKEQEMNNGTSF